MENIIYNELRSRGYNVDVGLVELGGKDENSCTNADVCEVVFSLGADIPRPAISSSKYFLRSNIMLECFF